MNVTEIEIKESTKHCCGNGYRRRDSAEHEEEGGALIDKRIAENNVTNADRRVDGLLEQIVSTENLNRAYKRVKRNKGAGGVDGMGVDARCCERSVGELITYLLLDCFLFCNRVKGRNPSKPVYKIMFKIKDR